MKILGDATWICAIFPLVLILQTGASAQQAASASSNPNRKTEACCPVIELRQYTLYPGQRDVLINLFEREFVESQEALGMQLVGTFRDLDNPDRFVWIRGFPNMAARAEALPAFYGGPVWKAHREAANATMADSSNVLLLQQVDPQSEFAAPKSARPPIGTSLRPSSLVVATIYSLNGPVDDKFIRFFEQTIKPLMIESGARPIAWFQTETAENNFPKLPVRTGENIFVWLSRFATPQEYANQQKRLAQSKLWTQKVQPELSDLLRVPPQQLKLQPTSRSQLR